MFFKKKACDVAMERRDVARLQLVDAMTELHAAQNKVNYLQQVIVTIDKLLSDGQLGQPRRTKVEPK